VTLVPSAPRAMGPWGPDEAGVRLRPLALLFLRAGNLTFGGGDAIAALLQRELVQRRSWLSLDQFGLILGLAQVTPGTRILACCAGAGFMLRRWMGAALAVLAVSVPSAAMTVLLTWAFTSLGDSRPAAAALAAVLAAAVGLMWAAAWLLVRPQLRGRTGLRTAVLAAGAFLALATGLASPIVVLAVAAAVGFAWTGEGAA